ncbi:ABC transporter substrate-binding protein [Jiangella sp. DSM 45060]|uniref:ABC transporter substrate-binding protein n=1 Tax=Jiangella sp. DSM 45060 TaxID=1798224 RepID=UPI00087A9334|nr:substrate-binding domain-containing protein [Jiangella sp. DSM 45060]SDT17681.1 ABC-type glycerol-3-phosphate transport system, substrate-binding protein [Jiangella sp. DSM 45060]
MNRVHDDLASLSRLRQGLAAGDLGRRQFLLGAAALSTTALLAGCGGIEQSDGDSGGGGVIPLYTVENDPKSLAFYNMVIAAFQEKHPEARVEVTVYSDSTQLQHLTTAFRNKVDVGIFSPPVSQFASWARDGYLAVLDDVVEEIGPDDFMPGTRIVVDGSDYAIPLQANSHLMYYRKDILQNAGIAAPETFDDFLAAARETHGGDGHLGIALAVGPTPQLPLFSFSPYIFQSGWDYFDRDGNVTFDRPEVLEAIERFVSMMRFSAQSLYNGEYADIVSAYSSGQATFAPFPGRLGVNLHESAPDIADASGVIPIPAGPFMTGGLHFGSGQQYALYAETEEPDLAKEFLKELTVGEHAVEFAMTVPGHLLPPMKSVRQELLGMLSTSADPYVSAHADWIETFAEHVPAAMTSSVSMGAVHDGSFEEKFTNVCPWAAEIWKSPPIDGVMFQSILIDGEPVEQAWRTAAEEMRAVSDGWKAQNPDWTPEIV